MNALAVVGFIFLIPALIIVSTLWNGWAVWVVWNWWAPVIGEWLPMLSYAGAVGMAAIANLFTHHLFKQDDSNGDATQRAFVAVTRIIVAPLVIVAGNWLILAVLV